MKRLLLSVAIVGALVSSVPAQAEADPRPTALTAHHVVMVWDGFNSAWYFGELSTILVDELTGDGVVGKTITFLHGDQVFCTAVTNSSGVAKCTDPSAQISSLANGGYTARFAGTDDFLPSSASAKRARVLGTEI
ncbi:MAG TPA: Ig-like domain-containing protein [Actinomycetota bacterium]|nr:Ig-like domain-containing protein [Actinomycetota bacterium]